MIRFLCCVVSIFLLAVMFARSVRADPSVQLGIDVLAAEEFKILEGKRVGVLVNPASVDSNLRPTALVLKEAKNVNLVALFGPEHGVWGDEYAGDKVADKTDPVTGLKAFSLYGATRKPTKEMLDAIDVLVIDLQDIGSRSYTYISTMKVCVEACAEQNKQLVILDRPNPLGGNRIEGGPVEKGFESFVSFLNVPYLHGMTMGELAMMHRAEIAPNWDGLTVVKMKRWTREMVWEDTGLQWIATSPHIPHVSSVAAYAATGIVGELGIVSNGVGYTLPFEIVGSPTTDGPALAAKMSAAWPDARGLTFRPMRFKPFYATCKGEICGGVQIHMNPRSVPSLVEINFRLVQAMNAPTLLAAVGDKPNLFDKSTGSDEIRKVLAAGGDLEPVFESWRKYCEEFREKRKEFLLYR